MKFFISYKFRGADKDRLKERIEKISSILVNKGHQTFAYFRDKQAWKVKNFPPGKAIKESLQEIKNCDIFLGIIDSAEKSEGMLLEFGFAKALSKKTILLVIEGYSFPTLEVISDKVIKFKDYKDLSGQLDSLKIKNVLK
jgi:nucleoside 2-deoxyribosyltransferase